MPRSLLHGWVKFLAGNERIWNLSAGFLMKGFVHYQKGAKQTPSTDAGFPSCIRSDAAKHRGLFFDNQKLWR